MKLKNLLPRKIIEESGGTYDYSCAMLYFDFPEIKKIHSTIDKNDIYIDELDESYGLEPKTHCTLLYGLHSEVTVDEVKSVIEKTSFSPCKFHNPSVFKSEKYDVLKFDVDGDNLEETNSKLKEFPYTSDYPDYHAHSTIAYLKPGMGEKYVKMMNENGMNEYIVTPSKVVYSEADDTKTDLSINITEISDSAKYYQNNPEARKKKQKYDAKLNKRPEQVKSRVETNKARRHAKKAGKNIKGKDASHTKNGIRFKESSKNRGSKTDSVGDRRARGGKK